MGTKIEFDLKVTCQFDQVDLRPAVKHPEKEDTDTKSSKFNLIAIAFIPKLVTG